jgi:serine/threonine-protein kinase
VPGAIVRVQDFAVVDTGPRIIETYDCVRNPEPSRPGGLSARMRTRGTKQPSLVELQWQGGASEVDVHRDGQHVATVANGGSYVEKISASRASYLVCNIDSSACSNTAIATPPRQAGPVLPPLD